MSLINCSLIKLHYSIIHLGQYWIRWWLVAYSTKPLSDPMLNSYPWDPWEHISRYFQNDFLVFIKMYSKVLFSKRFPWFHKGILESKQRCVVRGIALSSLCHAGSRPTWTHAAHLWRPPGPTCADPEAEASTGQFTRVWLGGHVLRCGATRSIVSDVSPGHAGRRAWTRTSESSQPAAQTSCPEPARRASFAWVRR